MHHDGKKQGFSGPVAPELIDQDMTEIQAYFTMTQS